MIRSPTALELFCGIGGFAAACESLTGTAPSTITSIDIDRTALEVHQQNFPAHRRIIAELASFDAVEHHADLWWLSPPCLPFTRKGPQRDRNDRRTESLLHLIRQIDAADRGPAALAIENVPPFAQSQTAAWIVNHFHRAGYATAWEILCPTQLGWPMRRRRAYLLASRIGLRPLAPARHEVHPLRSLFDRPDRAASQQEARIEVPATWLSRYAAAIDIVDPDQLDRPCACFTSSYGRSPVRSGSYLRDAGRVRFFTPSEILRCLGFPETFTWPASAGLRRRWELAGNSLSLPIVRWVLGRLGIE